MPPTTLTDHATPTEPGFHDAEYVVEATACERELLAWHWTHLGGVVVRDAEPGGSLYARAIGALDDVLGSAPLCVAVRWSVVSGHLVAFVEGYSQVTDYAAIRAWCRRVFRCLATHPERLTTAALFSDVVRDIRQRDGLAVDSPGEAASVLESVEASASAVRRHVTGARRGAGAPPADVVECPACGARHAVQPGPAVMPCECLRAIFLDAARGPDDDLVAAPSGGRWLVAASLAVSRVELRDPGFRVVPDARARGTSADFHLPTEPDDFTVLLDQHVLTSGDVGESKIVEVAVTRRRLAEWAAAIARALSPTSTFDDLPAISSSGSRDPGSN